MPERLPWRTERQGDVSSGRFRHVRKDEMPANLE